jgi:hypothetical protein
MRGKEVALRIDRVSREIESKGVPFRRHPLRQVPLGVFWKPDRRDAAAGTAAEQAVLAACPLVVCGCGMGKDRLCGGMDSGPIRIERVERSRTGKAFQLSPIEQLGIDPF